MLWQGKGFKFEFPRETLVMGILNLTPDSFSGDGILKQSGQIIKRAEEIESDGADIIDIGAESTRPGARELSVKEECARLLPYLKKIRRRLRIPISVDTKNSMTAELALQEGAQIINDVSCLRKDPTLSQVVAKHQAGLILMHSRGNSLSMKKIVSYKKGLLREIREEIQKAVKKARSSGVSGRSIAIDPGIGFAKTASQNWEILRSIERFRKIGYPICLGISRKSFLSMVTGKPPQERDWATTALHALLIERGADILRVHSVPAAKQAVRAAKNFLKNK